MTARAWREVPEIQRHRAVVRFWLVKAAGSDLGLDDALDALLDRVAALGAGGVTREQVEMLEVSKGIGADYLRRDRVLALFNDRELDAPPPGRGDEGGRAE